MYFRRMDDLQLIVDVVFVCQWYFYVLIFLYLFGVTWDDLDWIRKAWGGKIIVKGVHIGDDAKKAVDLGVDAIVVSNHGARQLDSVAPTIRVLPEIVSALNGKIDVLLDGGIRRGGVVVKALCLEAKGVLIGRAYAYCLAAGVGNW